jgi:hypothetical protein
VDDDIRPVAGLSREGYGPAFGRVEPETAPPSGVEWGAASLVLGGVFALMIPPALLLAGSVHVGGRDEIVVEGAGYLFALLILFMSAAGAAFGVLSVSAAQRARRPIALGLAGVMLNALSLLMWAGALLAWYSNWR